MGRRTTMSLGSPHRRRLHWRRADAAEKIVFRISGAATSWVRAVYRGVFYVVLTARLLVAHRTEACPVAIRPHFLLPMPRANDVSATDVLSPVTNDAR